MKNSYYILSLFSKENCSPCIMTSLALQQVVLPANVVFEKRKLEIDGEEEFRACGVQSTPTLVLYRSTEEGQIIEVRRHVGGANVETIESLLSDI